MSTSNEKNLDLIIDVDKILEARKAKLPKIVVSAIKSLLHVDFINEFLVKGYEGVEFCNEVIKKLDIKLEVEGLENIPNDGTLYTFASNHPLGGIDGVALGAIVGNKYNDIRYLVNDLLMNIKGLASISIPINKFGAQARNLPTLINETFNSDAQVIIFPAGLCSRKIKGVVRDLDWGKTFITKSKATGRYIVPVHFKAQNSKRFYRIAKLRKFLGIKVNIEMFFLPDEMYRAQHSSFKIVFGKPIDPAFFDNSKTPTQWASWVKEEVYKL